MTFTADSPLVKRVVPAPDNWTRNGAAVTGIVTHMAEGGGTVSWLTRDDGNSSHYVVEYDGDLVQMVDEERAAGSINPHLIRQNNDAPYTFEGEQVIYGRTAALTMGSGAANDPNRYVIAIEVEGFAATGPNAAQRATLAAIYNDIRRRKGSMPALGHRDFQNYKPCPGHRIPWPELGHHAKKAGYMPPVTPPPAGGSTVAVTGNSVPEVPTQLWLKSDTADPTKSRWLYVWSDHRPDPKNIQLQPNRPLYLTRFIDADTYAVAYEPSTPDANTTSLEMFVKSVDVAKTAPVAVTDEATIQKRISDALADANTKIGTLTTRINTIKAKVAALGTDVSDD